MQYGRPGKLATWIEVRIAWLSQTPRSSEREARSLPWHVGWRVMKVPSSPGPARPPGCGGCSVRPGDVGVRWLVRYSCADGRSAARTRNSVAKHSVKRGVLTRLRSRDTPCGRNGRISRGCLTRDSQTSRGFQLHGASMAIRPTAAVRSAATASAAALYLGLPSSSVFLALVLCRGPHSRCRSRSTWQEYPSGRAVRKETGVFPFGDSATRVWGASE